MPNPEEFRRTRRIVDLLLRISNQPRLIVPTRVGVNRARGQGTGARGQEG